jgi:hypothetical protein
MISAKITYYDKRKLQRNFYKSFSYTCYTGLDINVCPIPVKTTLVLIKINYGQIGDQTGLFYTTNPVFYTSGNRFVRHTGMDKYYKFFPDLVEKIH